jgi:peptidoglycan/xylan/chitin deacetylase (PgdA/CDA1 family)
MKKVLILNFHELSQNKGANPKTAYTFGADKFITIIDFIKKNKIPVISLHDLTNNFVNEDLSIALTFDDGNTSDFSIAYPILESNGLPATFFLTLNQIHQNQITWHNVSEMIKNEKITIGSHGITHRRMTELSSNEQANELLHSKQFIESKIKKSVDYFAMPYGVWDDHTIEISKRIGYKALFTTHVQINYPELYPHIFHRWSVTSNTSVDLLEKMITFNPGVLRRKIWSSKIKKLSKSVLGKNLSETLNSIYH